MLTRINKVIARLFTTRAAGFYFLVFAAAIGIATFIENDFGTSAAQKLIFKAWWFELLLVLFGGTILVNIFKFRMVQQKKWAVLTFHIAIIIIIMGAGVTRYFGYEGVMHIREQGTSDYFLSAESYLKFHVEKNGKSYAFDEPVLLASLGNNDFSEDYLIDNDEITVTLQEFIPNPEFTVVTDADNGKPTLKVVIAGMNGREEYYLSQGDIKRFGGRVYNFSNQIQPGAFNIQYQNNTLSFSTDRTLFETVMATQQKDTIEAGQKANLKLRALYSDGVNNTVFPEFYTNANTKIQSSDPKVKNESTVALILNVSAKGQTKEALVYGNKGMPGVPTVLDFEGLKFKIAYGSKEVKVPFQVQLNDFIMERYPGTNSASSYASEVTVIDPNKGVNMDYRIYMNNILDYGGFRFFQSSFDKDEKGTYLSVNHDWWGTIISYIGYALLTIGMLLTFFSKNTRFYSVLQKIKNLRAKSGTFQFLVIALMLSSSSIMAQKQVVSQDHAESFSTVVVQDFKGRMKPMHTLAREIMRKVSRIESWGEFTADQVVLSMFINKQQWYDEPMIYLGKSEKIKNQLGVSTKYASYKDFFGTDGKYKLQSEVRRVYSLDPIDRDIDAKDLMKIDERLNIVNMVFSGSIFKIVPRPNDPNHQWDGYTGHNHDHDHPTVAQNFFNTYGNTLIEATKTGDYKHAGHLLQELKDFQAQEAASIMPSPLKVKLEIMLNNMNIFTRLAGFYMILALVLLVLLFMSVFKPSWHLKKIYYVLFGLIVLGFILHTVGLGMRWYVSGRAPWSNGYESMIYIAWTSTLAGLIFTRKSFGGLAATMVLAGTVLFVSTLSFLDPEITPLVPVLKSYWLTIHVSMEAGSYGFLMLGAIIGLINLILMICLTESNKSRIKRIVQEMSYISELTLMGGLVMVSIGTYLGGVWANESWGRYWGWDAKETWALVTILVYAFILHMRLIPKLRGLFAYNLATIFGLASVLMTYYGVNYYLSGLHSYATGDPVPIPTWVYVAVACIIAISILAFIRKRKFSIS
ncbi:cytochrome C biogenesis protein [Hanstruepera neustonica]|uniref:Cytochrome C biogenesis protein n=1 Tax=Hanstruepera neustonica TaxID=1445657 RepID=A0A2K1DXW2_9FLAO|nr:cytochrome c biogenesis protein CcsA [Hanstruepera neustonica]PNQ72865.1 cytochrome C biogenesis protein [Hanstruepera neustonica]